MTETNDTPNVDEAVDNDVVLKAIRYGETRRFWAVETNAGVLGSARFVVSGRVKRLRLADTRPEITEELEQFFNRADALEPSDAELVRAAELEREAQRRALPVDAGESQLAAIVVARAIGLLTTGDKRAIRALQELLESVEWLKTLCGRVRCLEQLVLELVQMGDEFEELGQSICSDQDADRTLSTCFSCYSGGGADASAVMHALSSYINGLRRNAQDVMAPAP